jgi:hypothetical protein
LRGRRVQCLGTTLQGHPRHPLYLPGSTRPRAFRTRRRRRRYPSVS